MTEFNFIIEPTDELPYNGNYPAGVSPDDVDGGRYRSRFEEQVERADDDEGRDD